MRTFISPTASKLLKQVEETIILQEQLLTEADKAQYPFLKRVVTTVLNVYHANKITVLALALVSNGDGYSLSVNNEVLSFLEVHPKTITQQ